MKKKKCLFYYIFLYLFFLLLLWKIFGVFKVLVKTDILTRTLVLIFSFPLFRDKHSSCGNKYCTVTILTLVYIRKVFFFYILFALLRNKYLQIDSSSLVFYYIVFFSRADYLVSEFIVYKKRKSSNRKLTYQMFFHLARCHLSFSIWLCTTWCCLCWFFPLPRRAEWAPSSTSYSPGNRAVTCLPGLNRVEVISVSCVTHSSLFFAAWEQGLCTGHPAYKWFNVFWLMQGGH